MTISVHREFEQPTISIIGIRSLTVMFHSVRPSNPNANGWGTTKDADGADADGRAWLA